MKLVPSEPPGRSTRKARCFAPEMRELRTQGYTFEAIRQVLATVGVHVSNATVQREVARSCKGRVAALAVASAERAGNAYRSAATAPAPEAPGSEPTTTPLPDGPSTSGLRSGREIAEAFTSSQITNPLVRARYTAKDLP
jgi:hypothetical protein